MQLLYFPFLLRWCFFDNCILPFFFPPLFFPCLQRVAPRKGLGPILFRGDRVSFSLPFYYLHVLRYLFLDSSSSHQPVQFFSQKSKLKVPDPP